MSDQLLPFRPFELTFIGLYLSSLIVVGWLGFRARREHSLRDFYLAGKGIGFVALVLTLYATQYSGNTLFGFTGKTYRVGYRWAVCIHFMTAIVVFYLILAPKLYRLSRKYGFITPTDFLQHRFESHGINLCATIVMVVAIANYLLAQLMAMGRALEGLTDLAPEKAYIFGVVVLALIIVVYESLGGFRAVVWTDVIQGTVLLVGFVLLLMMVFQHFGSLESATNELMRIDSSGDSVSKVSPPGGLGTLEWISYILAVGIGGALYPQAIQRIYSARSSTSLRRSLALMAFLPLTTTLVAIIVGIMGAAYVPELGNAGSDKILTVICSQIQQHSLLGRWLVTVLFAAVLAAIMSTADSVLLSISSMVTKDVFARYVYPSATQRLLTRVGRATSWLLIASLVYLAIIFRDSTSLVDLLDRKFDLLLQLAPAYFVGIHWHGLRSGPTLVGMLAGLFIALLLAFTVGAKVFGFHPGLIGLAVNLVIAVGGSRLANAAGRND